MYYHLLLNTMQSKQFSSRTIKFPKKVANAIGFYASREAFNEGGDKMTFEKAFLDLVLKGLESENIFLNKESL